MAGNLGAAGGARSWRRVRPVRGPERGCAGCRQDRLPDGAVRGSTPTASGSSPTAASSRPTGARWSASTCWASCPRTPAAPPGILVTTLADRPDLVADVHAVALEAFPDIPSTDEPVDAGTLEAFVARDVDRAGIPKDAFFVALDAASGTVAGYASLIYAAGSRTVAYHDMTAVRRAYRGRGIAGALKRATIAWAVDTRSRGAGHRQRRDQRSDARREPCPRIPATPGLDRPPGSARPSAVTGRGILPP